MGKTLDALANHPNVGPFISRQLIQRFVTSNPSPAYVERVPPCSADQPARRPAAVIRAILLDTEARDCRRPDPSARRASR